MGLIAKTQKELADTIGISERTFFSWLQERCPGEARNYVVCEVIEWARINKWSDSDDDLLNSINDVELKRELIKERISKLQRDNRLADFKIEERDANLIDVGIMKEFLAQVSARIRNAITTIEKKYGPDSCSPIRGALDVTEKEIQGGAIDGDSSS